MNETDGIENLIGVQVVQSPLHHSANFAFPINSSDENIYEVDRVPQAGRKTHIEYVVQWKNCDNGPQQTRTVTDQFFLKVYRDVDIISRLQIDYFDNDSREHR